jgi:GNAT superfamily N-acetyltransferase
LSNDGFKPAYMIVAGGFKEHEEGQRGTFWDDRDPDYEGRDGTVCGYIFRKQRLCDVDLGGLKVERNGDTFHLVDGGVPVCIATVNYFHEKHADVHIQTFEEFRHKGYAAKLLGWVSDWLTENSYIHEGGCAADNRESLKLHLKLGFELAGHIRWSSASDS